MDLNETQEKAVSRYNVAMKRIKSGLDARNGGPGAEAEGALAYQDLVRLGVELPLKAKYRNGRQLKQVR
jgi:hypothetical protein